MAFSNGFEEDDNPQPVTNTTKRPASTLDLTTSPPPPPPPSAAARSPAQSASATAASGTSSNAKRQKLDNQAASGASASTTGATTVTAQASPSPSSNRPTLPSLQVPSPAQRRVTLVQQHETESPQSYAPSQHHPLATATVPTPALAASGDSSSGSVGFARYAHQQSSLPLPADAKFVPRRSRPPTTAAASTASHSSGQTLTAAAHGSSTSQTSHHRSVPVIKGAGDARVPSSNLARPAPMTAASLPNPTSSGTKSSAPHQVGPKNYYRMQSMNVAASKDALAAKGILPPRARTMSGSNAGASTSSSNANANVAGIISAATLKGKQRASESDSIIDLTTPGRASTTPVVDLSRSRSGSSSDADDDVIVDDSPVCIGQLTTLALILYHVAEIQPPPPALDESGQPLPPPTGPPPYLPPLPVHILRSTPQSGNETLKLVTPGRREVFGVIEHRVANLMGPLLGDGWSGTGIATPTKGTAWCEASVVRRSEKSPMMLPLQLLLFTRPLNIQPVADLLASKAVYLEHPRSYAPQHHFNARYSNPHNPAFGVGAGGEMRRNRLVNGMRGAATMGMGVEGMTRSGAAGHGAQAVDAIRRIMQDMPSGPDLDEVEPPAIVTTKLYTHQKQALAFLLDRERLVDVPPALRTVAKAPPKIKKARPPPAPSSAGELVISSDEDEEGEARRKEVEREQPIVSLWQRRVNVFGVVTGWDHLASDLRIQGERTPPQTRGAILADDMGLGKTIVVISLVASTLSDAQIFASKPCTRDGFDERFDSFASTSKQTAASNASLSEFGSNIYGLADTGADAVPAPSTSKSGSAGNSKKKQAAKLKRERKREDAIQARYDRLVTRSRATLIVCPLSTVQNWESQFEEHTSKDGARDVTLGGDAARQQGLAGGQAGKEKEKAKGEGRAYRVKREAAARIIELKDGDDGDGDNGGDHDEAAYTGSGSASASTSSSADDGAEEEPEEDSDAAMSEDDDDNDDDEDGADIKPSKRKTKGKGRTAQSAASSPKKKGKSNKRALSIYVYHGHTRTTDPLVLADYDVVITTYSTLGTEFSKQCRAEDEREEEELRRQQEELEGGKDEVVEVYGYGANGEVIETKPWDEIVQPGKKLKKKRVFKRKVAGSGVSPLQQVQWFRVVLDEAHIIKEHTTIQARAACELMAERRIALSGTPLQNSLNDLFSLVRFLRLEPLTDRGVWTQHIGALVKAGQDTGIQRLRLIMRHLTLRRTKDSKTKDGKAILSLPAVVHTTVKLRFTPAEHAYYTHYHQRYKHDFEKLERTDSVMKNICSILQELLRLRQICVHPALLQDSEDAAFLPVAGGGDGEEGDAASRAKSKIEQHGISKARAIQLLAPMRDIGGAQCNVCGTELMAPSNADGDEDGEGDKPKKKRATAAARKPRTGKIASTSASAACSEDDGSGNASVDPAQTTAVITRCQHVFCRPCFADKVAPGWPSKIKPADRAQCSACAADLTPAMDAVELTSVELEKALAQEKDEETSGNGGKRGRGQKKKKASRPFEHSTKTRALLDDLLPFSRANPTSANYDGRIDEDSPEWGHTIGFQPVKGDVVKSVVFSQWTKLLDRIGDALDVDKIGYDRLDGGMNRDARNRAMEAFKVDPRCEVLLVSLRAGGVGLNLTAGRRVYLMEPFWNPAVEDQAVDRIYRLGQTRSVQTIRFIMRRSIEKNMLKVQQRKLELIAKSLTNTLSKQDMKSSKLDEIKVYLDDRFNDDSDEEEGEDAAAAASASASKGKERENGAVAGTGTRDGDVEMAS